MNKQNAVKILFFPPRLISGSKSKQQQVSYIHTTNTINNNIIKAFMENNKYCGRR